MLFERHNVIKYFAFGLCLSAFTFLVFSQSHFQSKPQALNQSAKINFARDIKPLLENRCFPCHSAQKAMGQLRLDDERLALKGGITGAVIIPGKGKASPLI